MKRIAIIGTTGSGKTTLARQISERVSLPHIELDSLFWNPNWEQSETTIFQARTVAALSGDTWICDGNYKAVRTIVWVRADTLLWLDYPLLLVLNRLIRRSVRRIRTKERVCGDNYERGEALFGRESLICYALKTHFSCRKTFPEEFAMPEYAHLYVHRFRSSRQTALWVSRLPIPQRHDKIKVR